MEKAEKSDIATIDKKKYLYVFSERWKGSNGVSEVDVLLRHLPHSFSLLNNPTSLTLL